jgi:hypothetical protein
MSRYIDLTGKVFGKLTVLSLNDKIEEAKNKYEYHWICKCECGNLKSIPGKNLRNGWTKSCGCLTKPSNITGNKYGKLKVISFDKETKDKNGRNRYYWNCLCECGKIKSVYVNYLRSGKEVSCGCSRQLIDLQGKKYGKLTVLKLEGKNKTPKGTRRYLWKCQFCVGNRGLVESPFPFMINTLAKSKIFIGCPSGVATVAMSVGCPINLITWNLSRADIDRLRSCNFLHSTAKYFKTPDNFIQNLINLKIL